MSKGFGGWGAWFAAQSVFTFIWQIAIKLAENAMLGWGDDQIAAWFGVTSPTLSTVITWTIPFILAFGTLWVFHRVTTRPLKEALARQSGGDRFSAPGIVSGPSRRWIQRLVAVVGVVWKWREASPSQPPQITDPPFPSPPTATTVHWKQLFGTSRAVDLVFALFLDGKGPDFKSIKLKDAFLESGVTGEIIKMKTGSANPPDNPFPISEASLIPPNVSVVRVFGTGSGLK